MNKLIRNLKKHKMIILIIAGTGIMAMLASVQAGCSSNRILLQQDEQTLEMLKNVFMDARY
jgi:hypothetical protein